jgi:urea transporter
MIVGSVVATVATRLARRYVPFPTYTAPFIVTTWGVFFLGLAMGAVRPEAGGPGDPSRFSWSFEAVANGVGQVMFQGGVWTGLLFLIGIAVSDRRHAAWVLAGSVVGMLVAYFHASATERLLDPESLIERPLYDSIALGLYGYNACLSAVALSLWRRSMFPPLVGMFLAVLLTDLLPLLGVPALTAPFVAATWLVLALGRVEGRVFPAPELAAP